MYRAIVVALVLHAMLLWLLRSWTWPQWQEPELNPRNMQVTLIIATEEAKPVVIVPPLPTNAFIAEPIPDALVEPVPDTRNATVDEIPVKRSTAELQYAAPKPVRQQSPAPMATAQLAVPSERPATVNSTVSPKEAEPIVGASLAQTMSAQDLAASYLNRRQQQWLQQVQPLTEGQTIAPRATIAPTTSEVEMRSNGDRIVEIAKGVCQIWQPANNYHPLSAPPPAQFTKCAGQTEHERWYDNVMADRFDKLKK